MDIDALTQECQLDQNDDPLTDWRDPQGRLLFSVQDQNAAAFFDAYDDSKELIHFLGYMHQKHLPSTPREDDESQRNLRHALEYMRQLAQARKARIEAPPWVEEEFPSVTFLGDDHDARIVLSDEEIDS